MDEIKQMAWRDMDEEGLLTMSGYVLHQILNTYEASDHLTHLWGGDKENSLQKQVDDFYRLGIRTAINLIEGRLQEIGK